jgi:hypothetical protein
MTRRSEMRGRGGAEGDRDAQAHRATRRGRRRAVAPPQGPP